MALIFKRIRNREPTGKNLSPNLIIDFIAQSGCRDDSHIHSSPLIVSFGRKEMTGGRYEYGNM